MESNRSSLNYGIIRAALTRVGPDGNWQDPDPDVLMALDRLTALGERCAKAEARADRLEAKILGIRQPVKEETVDEHLAIIRERAEQPVMNSWTSVPIGGSEYVIEAQHRYLLDLYTQQTEDVLWLLDQLPTHD